MLNADYFRRIDAMHYVLAHDDGQAQPGLAEADVVLVGVSRSSKTPTCFYLANRGIKAANVPLVPNLPEPPGLETVECPVIGLTLEAEALIEIRRHRLRLIAAGNAAGIARQNSTEYVDEDAVKAELLWARRLCNRRGWPVIDVTRRSIEETAATVLQLMDAWHERRRKDAAGEDLMLQRPGPRLVLASASASRRALLTAAGLTFEVRPADIDEAAVKRDALVRGHGGRGRRRCCLAELKAAAVARQEPDALVIGADQILVCDGVWFDKPADVAAAREQLRALARSQPCAWSPRWSAIAGMPGVWHHVAVPRLAMRDFSDAFLDDYLAAEGDAVISTVGAYRLEGRGIQLFERSRASTPPFLACRAAAACVPAQRALRRGVR